MFNHFATVPMNLLMLLGCLLATTTALSTDTGSEGNGVSVGGSTLNNEFKSEYVPADKYFIFSTTSGPIRFDVWDWGKEDKEMFHHAATAR
ncbi:GL26261 [Drosophila persimilis]|uniref:GL26261 n=1 Tax=Drosophila persimilis TaxID=7234 RepID=B4GJC5_DROPE|nr:GL26261 [Drosophila persimilis]